MTTLTIIVPVYNKLPHLERCVESILAQSSIANEVLFICDPSTDGSTGYIESVCKINKSISMLVRGEPGPGGYAARNLGIKKATSEWIAFLDADDAWNDDHLKVFFSLLPDYQNCEFFVSGYRKVTSNDIIDSRENYEVKPSFNTIIDFLRAPRMQTSGIIIKKSLLKSAGLFPEGRMRRGGDMDLFLRCLDISKGFVNTGSTTSLYYVDSVNMATKSNGFTVSDFENSYINRMNAHGVIEFFFIKRRRNNILYFMIKENLRMKLDVKRLFSNLNFIYSPVRFLLYWLAIRSPFIRNLILFRR